MYLVLYLNQMLILEMLANQLHQIPENQENQHAFLVFVWTIDDDDGNEPGSVLGSLKKFFSPSATFIFKITHTCAHSIHVYHLMGPSVERKTYKTLINRLDLRVTGMTVRG